MTQGLFSLLRLPPALTRHRLTIVDGAFRAELSAQENLPEGFFGRCEGEDAFYALTVRDQTCLAVDPVELLFITTEKRSVDTAPAKIKISLGQNSRLTLIERHMDSGDAQGAAAPIETTISLDAQSKLVHGKIVKDGGHCAQTTATVAAGASYEHFGLVAGGRNVRCAKNIDLTGPLAEARFSCVLLLREKEGAAMTALIRHLAPCGASRQACRAVLDGKARGTFAGNVFVDARAQQTDAYQLCRTLLLSDQAAMEARPELEIHADDVKCSHGATIGDLDETALFYLLSRGIAPQAARAMLVDAFASESLETIGAPELAAAVRQEVAQWLA